MKEADLACQGGDDGLRVDQRRVAQVVQAVVAEDLGASLEPHGLIDGGAVGGQQLRGHAAEGAEHRPPSVDQLQAVSQDLSAPDVGNLLASHRPSASHELVCMTCLARKHTSISRYLAKVSGSAERPAVSQP